MERTLEWPGGRLDMGRRTLVMGIVNVTPDSFSDGGLFHDRDRAVEQGLRLVEEGADILDVGGESTRPGSDPVTGDQELSRVLPVIRELSARVSVPVSVDTSRARVAAEAFSAGATILNDVSALRGDPDMARVAAEAQAPVVLMHMLGTPRTMQKNPSYEDVVREVAEFLSRAMDRAVEAGVKKDLILVDPGIGFGKTLSHNLCLIRELSALAALGAPVLLGPSRKAFIRKILSPENGPEPGPRSEAVETGTQAVLAAAAVMGSAQVVRVHDVARARATLAVADALRNGEM